ncbi:hypothetical protein M1L60_07300 [Actinoplanes sp. TRM 88003]|uniref:Transmembrane protein n=1 Tax=Paractinoplanes aksuensis TaxID=2939490 RepID=A0ABT1DK31_9ACTN|nr:hypothetical protein [Actinoplanes aksuensis]MCO8270400.1 hypothetical protein [Actinoplanes aksuensis]
MNGTAAALTFVWLGMILAISFLEAPLKFRAPGVTLPIGLGIGRLVFRALNGAEIVLAVGLGVFVAAGQPGAAATIAAGVAPALLLVQLLVVRPRLSRRTARVLGGEQGPRSHAHIAYVIVETAKVAALITAGALLMVASA